MRRLAVAAVIGAALFAATARIVHAADDVGISSRMMSPF
jgi:hypothetical protein